MKTRRKPHADESKARYGHKNISTKALAQAMGASEKTARNKLDGVTEFTFCEALTIAENLFPEYDLRYLFARNGSQRKAG